jgi:hypothetical protein
LKGERGKAVGEIVGRVGGRREFNSFHYRKGLGRKANDVLDVVERGARRRDDIINICREVGPAECHLTGGMERKKRKYCVYGIHTFPQRHIIYYFSPKKYNNPTVKV